MLVTHTFNPNILEAEAVDLFLFSLLSFPQYVFISSVYFVLSLSLLSQYFCFMHKFSDAGNRMEKIRKMQNFKCYQQINI